MNDSGDVYVPNNYISPDGMTKLHSRRNTLSSETIEKVEEPIQPSMIKSLSRRNVTQVDSIEKNRSNRLLNRIGLMLYNGTLSSSFQISVTIFTIWALFSDNIRLARTTKDADLSFEVIITIIFFFFIYEIIIRLLYEDKYFTIPKFTSERADETFFERWYRRSKVGSFYFCFKPL